MVDYNYDSYNRLVSFGPVVNGTYTAAYTYTYDTGTKAMGRLGKIVYAAGDSGLDQATESFNYTAAGEISSKSVTVANCVNPGVCGSASPLTISATYDGEGHRQTMTTPIGAYTYSYDQMERATGMTDTPSGNVYVNGISYSVANQMTAISYASVAGHPLTNETRTYNSLLQLTKITDSGINLTYNYVAGSDNRKISSVQNGVSGESSGQLMSW